MIRRDNLLIPKLMKKLILSLASGIALLAAPSVAPAAPLQRSQISADAKWLVHLDLESLRGSTFGSTLIKVALAEIGDDMKGQMPIDIQAVVQQTGSVTVYGKDFQPGKHGPDMKGVLIWQGSKDIESVVSGLLIQQAEAAKAGQGGIKALTEGLNPTYEVTPNLFVAVRPGQGILVSPKSEEIDEACRVIEGKAPSLGEKTAFSDYPTLPGGFFFLALAEGFARDLGLPPQAQVLKLAEGGRIGLGESSDKLQLSVSLKAQTTENAVQIQQVVQGLVALASLADVDEPELVKAKEWLRGAQVKAVDKVVSLDIAVPVDAALKQIGSATGKEFNIEPAKKESAALPAAAPSSSETAAAPATSAAAR